MADLADFCNLVANFLKCGLFLLNVAKFTIFLASNNCQKIVQVAKLWLKTCAFGLFLAIFWHFSGGGF